MQRSDAASSSETSNQRSHRYPTHRRSTGERSSGTRPAPVIAERTGSSSSAVSSRMMSPTALPCTHPECLAMSSGDDAPRCRKLQPQQPSIQIQTQALPPVQSPSTPRTPTSRHVKLRCDKCSDYPDGFRSEHELRRHTNRVHREVRKVWMTVDASQDKTFLANCKSCQTGKRYNECYNAASHLRRMHFHPRKRGEGKGEKRGGAGSVRSEDPPMEILKKDWLREVEEVLGESSTDANAGDDSNEDKMEIDNESTDIVESDTSPTQ